MNDWPPGCSTGGSAALHREEGYVGGGGDTHYRALVNIVPCITSCGPGRGEWDTDNTDRADQNGYGEEVS